jgi:hypothetical protein
LSKQPSSNGEFTLKCNCRSNHKLSSQDELPTSEIALNVLKQAEHGKQELDFKPYLDELEQKMRIEKFEIYKHYDNVINDIDIRAESLINFIHKSREILQNQVKARRDESLAFFENKDSLSSADDKPEVARAKLNFQRLTKGLASDAVSAHDLNGIVANSDKLQLFMHELKKNCWYFAENTMKLDNSLLGYNLNHNLDKSFYKFRNLKTLISQSSPINLLTQFQHSILRQEVLPLSKERIVKIYFTTNRTLHFEVFDSSGNLIKSLNAFENLSSFPISYGYGQHFLVCFTAKSSNNDVHNFFDMSSNFIQLYDSNLNLIKSITQFSSIESVYMNNSSIFLFYSHKKDACCSIYDYKLNEMNTFGQQTNDKAAFYMEKSNLNWREQMSMNFKVNPKLFGYDESNVYICNFNKMSIMSRKSGEIVNSMALLGSRPYFLLDSQSNIIQVNNLSKKLTLYNTDLEVLNKTTYDDTLDNVYVTKDNQIAFVDLEKKYVIFI